MPNFLSQEHKIRDQLQVILLQSHLAFTEPRQSLGIGKAKLRIMNTQRTTGQQQSKFQHLLPLSRFLSFNPLQKYEMTLTNPKHQALLNFSKYFETQIKSKKPNLAKIPSNYLSLFLTTFSAITITCHSSKPQNLHALHYY